jgi:hypothetical protein
VISGGPSARQILSKVSAGVSLSFRAAGGYILANFLVLDYFACIEFSILMSQYYSKGSFRKDH